MLKIYVALLTLIAGVTATGSCNGNLDFVLYREACHNENAPKEFPGTAEQLEEFCTFAVNYFECGVKYAKRCDNSDLLDETSKYLSAFQEVCNQDTLLYAATVDNIECVKNLMMEGFAEECRRQHRSTADETLQKYIDALTDEGILALSGDGNNTLPRMSCIHMLQEFACYATKIEDKCGTTALDAYVETTLKFSAVATCGETYHYLPTIIRVYKLQKEQVYEVEEVLKKRK